MAAKQNTSHILMVRPGAFRMNTETASDNHYQHAVKGLSNTKAQAQALKEFDGMVEKLREAGINVIVVDDTTESKTPDSVFPNNWISMHQNGVVVLYPMHATNRRKERRPDILERLKTEGFRINQVMDLSISENEGRFLEGTGSLVLDHENSVAFACLSQRTDEQELKNWAELTGYKVISFRGLQDVNGALLPIYHTNVMMSVGQEIAILCADCIRDEADRQAVVEALERTGKQIVFITEDQADNFAGNMLQVVNGDGQKIMVMSSQACNSLTNEQVAAIQKTNRIVHSPLNTIEVLGGGSARCMMAEVFLPMTP